MESKLIEQILIVRDTGLTNMFDVKAVFIIAAGMGLLELTDFIAVNPLGYFNFVLTGDDLYLVGARNA